MELDTQVTIRVPRSPDDAFAFIARDFFANHPRWDTAIVEMTQTSAGAVGVGTTGREVRSFAGKQAADFRITEFEPGRRFAFTNTSGAFWLDRAYDFDPDDGGTAISFSFKMRPRILPVRLLFPMIKGQIEKQVRANIERLATLLQ